MQRWENRNYHFGSNLRYTYCATNKTSLLKTHIIIIIQKEYQISGNKGGQTALNDLQQCQSTAPVSD